jgi:hypothetical protein
MVSSGRAIPSSGGGCAAQKSRPWEQRQSPSNTKEGIPVILSPEFPHTNPVFDDAASQPAGIKKRAIIL